MKKNCSWSQNLRIWSRINRALVVHLLVLASYQLAAPSTCSAEAPPLPSDTPRATTDANSFDKYMMNPEASPCTISQTLDWTTGVRYEVKFGSVNWQGAEWKHRLFISVPRKLKQGHLGYLVVAGSGDLEQERREAEAVAMRNGMVGIVLGDVPNQPLFEGKKEDDLLAYSFDRFFATGDSSWPAILPMVKSTVRAMDCVTNLLPAVVDGKSRQFIVTGASKRGWVSWLTGLYDKRVIAIAPRVFDMLNMPAQIDWAKAKYGEQSEKIGPYTKLGLTERLHEPRGVELLSLIDPYRRLKNRSPLVLAVLGANDPYWVVDSSSHYWADVQGNKSMVVVPNVGHKVSGEPVVQDALAEWVGRVAQSQALPEIKITRRMSRDRTMCVSSSEKFRSGSLWFATAKSHDFREALWLEHTLTRSAPAPNSDHDDGWCGVLPYKCVGKYCAYFVTLGFQGGTFALSTPPAVLPPAPTSN